MSKSSPAKTSSTNSTKPAIVVELSPVEHRGFLLAGDAEDDEIAGIIEIVLLAGGVSAATARYLAEKLAESALAAREKIRVATRYEVKVVEVSGLKESGAPEIQTPKTEKPKKKVPKAVA